MEFKPGDLVRLKSGSALMTVESVGDKWGEPTVFCVWSENVRGKQDVMRDSFPPTALEFGEKPKGIDQGRVMR